MVYYVGKYKVLYYDNHLPSNECPLNKVMIFPKIPTSNDQRSVTLQMTLHLQRSGARLFFESDTDQE